MKKLYLLLAIIHLSKGLPVHLDKTDSKSRQSSAGQRQYVPSVAQQHLSNSAGTQMNTVQQNTAQYGQHNPPQYTQQYGQQYGQQYAQQYGQQNAHQNGGREAPSAENRGHNGLLYSRRPVPDPKKDIDPPNEKKYKKKTAKEDDDNDEEE